MNRFVVAVMLLGGVAWSAEPTADTGDKGAKMWKAKCAQCHGVDGKGATKQGVKMGISDVSKPEWQKEFTDQKIKDVLSSGIKRERDGKKQEMDQLGKELTPEQFDALIAYVRSLAAATPAPAPVTKK